DRSRQRFPLFYRRPDVAANTGDGVAFSTTLVRQESLTALCFPRPFEVAGGIEISEQISGFIRRNLWNRDVFLTHCGPHHGRVTPHSGGDTRGRVIAIQPPAEIGRLARARTLHVTIDAALGLEEVRAASGVGIGRHG